jgi:argininosuccinate synthase
MTVPPEKAPAKAAYVTIDFKSGTPTAVNGKKMPGHEVVAKLNTLGGKHGVGIALLAENRLVGMKSRGVYETPGGTILYEAHKALQQLCMERDTYHHALQLATRYAELVYNGQWYHPLREAMQAFFDEANSPLTGSVKVKLYKGRAMAVSVESKKSLYDLDLASFAMDGYDITAARGFIDLFALPMKVRGMKQKPKV